MSDIFDGVEKLEPFTKDPWVLAGNYTVAVEDCKYIKESQKDSCPVYIMRMRIIRSNNPQRPAGSIMGWILKLKQNKGLKAKLADIAAAVARAYGCDVSKVTGAVVTGTYHPSQPIRGKLIKFTAADIPMNAGGVYTKLTFEDLMDPPDVLTRELEAAMRNPTAPAPAPAAAPAPAPQPAGYAPPPAAAAHPQQSAQPGGYAPAPSAGPALPV